MCKTKKMIFSGYGISSGFGIGKAFVYSNTQQSQQVVYKIDRSEVQKEYVRVKNSFNNVLRDLRQSEKEMRKKLDDDFARIFCVHQEILKDPSLRQEIQDMIAKIHFNAEFAVTAVFNRLENRLRNLDHDRFAERADDIADLSNRIVQNLTGHNAHQLSDLPSNTVVVAKQLLPSDTIHLSRSSVSAIIVERGGSTSHAAIITRELGIPAVSGIKNIPQYLQNGETVLVDGMQGTVIIEPDEAQKKAFHRRKIYFSTQHAKACEHATEPAITCDSTQVVIMANISCQEDAVLAAQHGADGIGLYRSEHLYFDRNSLPDEYELFEAFQNTLAPFSEDTLVTLRLLDTGGDKPLPFLDYPRESTPLMGRRGVRFLLEFPELLTTQLRCFLRLSKERAIRILVPMVTVASDMQAVKIIYTKTAADLSCKQPPPLGSMVETPAAALCVESIAEYSDFFSVGTNDLTQYTMAAGRENVYVANYFQQDNPAIFRLLRYLVQGAGDRPVGVCGELASQLNTIKDILATGVRELSVSPMQVPHVKQTIREICIDKLEKRNNTMAFKPNIEKGDVMIKEFGDGSGF